MLAELKAYFRAPFDRLDESVSLAGKFQGVLRILALDLGFALLAGLLIGMVNELDLVDLDNHAVATALQQFTLWQLLLIAILGTPLVEELVFRLPLRFASNPVVGLARIFTPKTDPDTDAQLAAGRRAWWDRNYRYVFYGLALAFALMHLTNYPEITPGLLLLSPLLVAPQFVMGILAGFLRVRYGFGWAFLLHALHNLILVGLAILGTGNTEIISVDNEAYRLVVEEVSPMERAVDFTYSFGEDTIGYHNTELKVVVRTLITDAETAVVVLPKSLPNPRINVAFKNHTDPRPAKVILLDTLQAHYELTMNEELKGDTIFLDRNKRN